MVKRLKNYADILLISLTFTWTRKTIVPICLHQSHVIELLVSLRSISFYKRDDFGWRQPFYISLHEFAWHKE